MNVLALVPARGQSKRLPGKNIRPLAGRPLIAWTIAAARAVRGISEIVVSTDDPQTAAIAREAGASVPWLRPADLATDTASSVDVALHALDWYEQARGAAGALLLLQPTSPFRSAATIEQALARFAAGGGRAVVGVSPSKAHPAWTFRIDGDTLVPIAGQPATDTRSQDLDPCYVVNGCVYVVSPADLRASRSFFPARAMPFIIDSPRETLDIDTAWDWRLAECLAADAPAAH